MEFDYPKKLRFRCEKCGLCCGDTKDKVRRILLLEIEAERISQKTHKSLNGFAEKLGGFEPYTHMMKKTEDGKCVFLKDNLCTIYHSRPLICRFYPFELKENENHRHAFAFTDECPAIGKGPNVEKSYFEKLLKLSIKTMRENTHV